MVESGVGVVQQSYEKATKLYSKAVEHGKKNQKLPPATDAGWKKLWEFVTLAQMVENSLRRSGFEGCIYGDKGCPSEAPASCMAH
jgi:TPR repeat protein